MIDLTNKTRPAKICCECRQESISHITRLRIMKGLEHLSKVGINIPSFQPSLGYCTNCKAEQPYETWSVFIEGENK